MRTLTTPPFIAEVLEVGTRIDDAGHRPVCSCGWVGRRFPLGQLDTARARLRDHHAEH